MKYNWQQPDWTNFKYNLQGFEDKLSAFAEETAHISGILKAMPENLQMETIINMMVSEAIKTSEIEGEYLNRPDVMSSIRNNLGLNKTAEKVRDKKSQGAGELMVAVRNTYAEPLSKEMLFDWHKMLMKNNIKIGAGAWRTHQEPMQVISGTVGKEMIHFEAPPSSALSAEMKNFITWFNDTAPGKKKEIKKAPVRSAIAHLYFETLHPFEDGNGRIGRAIAEKALSQTLGRPVLLSLSQTIEEKKKHYYNALKKAQSGNEITKWVGYFLNVVLDSQLQARKMVDLTLKKTKFFDRYKDQLNDRQIKVIRKMMEAEPNGFEGGMTARKYISITRASKATSTRDLQQLVEMKVFLLQGGGRSIHYNLNL